MTDYTFEVPSWLFISFYFHYRLIFIIFVLFVERIHFLVVVDEISTHYWNKTQKQRLLLVSKWGAVYIFSHIKYMIYIIYSEFTGARLNALTINIYIYIYIDIEIYIYKYTNTLPPYTIHLKMQIVSRIIV